MWSTVYMPSIKDTHLLSFYSDIWFNRIASSKGFWRRYVDSSSSSFWGPGGRGHRHTPWTHVCCLEDHMVTEMAPAVTSWHGGNCPWKLTSSMGAVSPGKRWEESCCYVPWALCALELSPRSALVSEFTQNTVPAGLFNPGSFPPCGPVSPQLKK